MNQQLKYRRIVSALLTVLLCVLTVAPTALPVDAANKRFITELRLEAGENAVDTLEKDGWSVMMVGLNVTSDPTAQLYLAYKTNTGDPITNVIVSPDVGNSLTDSNGFVYNRVSHVDVDQGIGGAAGCIYATRDKRAGAPLVGLDVLRGNDENILYPITNDGAEIVRTPGGTPADLEAGGADDYVYLAQIRDGIVRPYISEIGVVTDTDKWNAVYTACERGYNYYVDGDIDNSADTFTIIAYERTADAENAITNVVAVSEQTIRAIEEARITDPAANTENATAAAVSISGAQYVRVSGIPVSAEQPYYLYMTKDRSAGNPVSMIFAETPEQTQNFMFGMWANSYFFSPGTTTAYTYCVNEDLYATLWEDQTVCTKIPVRYLENHTQAAAVEPAKDATAEQPAENQTETAEKPAETTEQPAESQAETTERPAENQTETTEQPAETTEQPAQAPAPEKPAADSGDENAKYINLTMLTPRDGLPESAGRITGMSDRMNFNYVERTGRTDRVNKYQASVFGTGGVLALVFGVVAIACAAAFVIFKKYGKKRSSEKTKKAR